VLHTLSSARVRCGWPQRELTWHVHRARRITMPDATWQAAICGPRVTGGRVTLSVAGEGRVLSSMQAAFTCASGQEEGNANVGSTPAYELVRADGSFLSPQVVTSIDGVNVSWSGSFSAAGALQGTLTTYDPCTRAAITATFSAAAPSSRQPQARSGAERCRGEGLAPVERQRAQRLLATGPDRGVKARAAGAR